MAQNNDQKNKSGRTTSGSSGNRSSASSAKSGSQKSTSAKSGSQKSTSAKNGSTKNSSAPKKSGQSSTKAKTGSGKSAADTLDSVRGGGQRSAASSRGQEAARKAAGRENGGKAASAQNGGSQAKSRTQTAGNSAKKNAQTGKSSAKSGTQSGGASVSKPAKKNSSKKESTFSWQRFAIIAVLVLVCMVLTIQVVSCAGSSVDSRQTVMVTLTDKIETNGIAIRNEQIITSDQSGVIVSTVKNGGKVSKGETVANVFSSTDAAGAYQRMAEIRETLEQFENMATAGEESASEVTALQKSIGGELLRMSQRVYAGDISGSADIADQVLYLINKTQIATRVTEDFSHKVNALEDELKTLEARYPDKPAQLRSPLAGYFISDADGYESLLNTDVCFSLTPEKLDEILDVRSEPKDRSIVGKIADDYTWYMACEVSAEDADRLRKNADGSYVNGEYKLFLTYSDLDSITARLVGVNTGADASRKVLIFECSYMVSELSSVRIQPVSIQLSSYSGLEVNAGSIVTCDVEMSVSGIAKTDVEAREALARVICPQMFAEEEVSGTNVSAADTPGTEVSEADVSGSDVSGLRKAEAARLLLEDYNKSVSEITKGLTLPKTIIVAQKGVYVVWGDEIKFKRIKVVYQTGDKVLCEYNLGDSWLKMYDNVVDNPKGVYNGKIINVR